MFKLPKMQKIKIAFLIFILFIQSCMGTYPHLLVNEKGRIARKNKVNNVCEFDSGYLKIKK